MTKVLVFGDNNEQKKELKRIKFKYMFDCDAELVPEQYDPSEFQYVMLIEKGYTRGSNKLDNYDLIMAWDTENNKTLYLGHWNDGVV